MKKVIAVAALLALAACGKKETPAPAADSTTVAPATTDTAAHDSTMPRDTARQM